MSAHNKLWPPSSAERWVHCTASPKLLANLPRTSNEYAAEGTLAHQVLDALLVSGDLSVVYPVGATRHVDTYDVVITDAMHEHAMWAREYVKSFVADDYLSESQVRIKLGDNETNGTADVIGAAQNTLHVFDYKYGRGVAVDAKDNLQMSLYALGALDSFGFYWEQNFTHVCMHIMQPRISTDANAHTVEVADLETLRKWFTRRAAESLTDAAVYRPGEKQCMWCPLKGECKAYARFMEETALAGFDEQVEDLSPEQFRDVLNSAPAIRKWLDAVADEALKRLQVDPKAVPGFKVVEGRSMRQWDDADGVEAFLAESYGGDSMYVRKLVSPAQAEKALPLAIWKRVETCIVKPEGKPTLAPDSDKRPARSMGFEDLDDISILE